jgi:hypothetical protein
MVAVPVGSIVHLLPPRLLKPLLLKLVCSIKTLTAVISLIKPLTSSPRALKLRISPRGELAMERWSPKGSNLSRLVATHAMTVVSHARTVVLRHVAPVVHRRPHNLDVRAFWQLCDSNARVLVSSTHSAEKFNQPLCWTISHIGLFSVSVSAYGQSTTALRRQFGI